MKKSRFFLFSTALLTGCASYEANMLSPLPVHTAAQAQQSPQVLVSWKVYDTADSKMYLGRDVLSEGYTPIQLTVRNNSQDPLYLSPHNFSIPLPSANEVANKVHTSTAARVAGWGIPGLFIWPLLIPAVYDGIKSSEANDQLDADYRSKAIAEQIIQPHSGFNGVIFVPNHLVDSQIEMFLINQRTNEKIACPLQEVMVR